ncbi:MAG: hypothetical protein JWM69_1559 [Candidatus Binatus sp.]|nr:hypothetical protein [Candidatus Binatus sp.]
MQEVAFHLARCVACTGTLSDYTAMARGLRAITSEPDLTGFASAVRARIDALPQPFSTRVAHFFERSADLLSARFAWGGAVAAVAVVTAILITPYASQFAQRQLPTTATVASAPSDAAKAPEQVADSTERTQFTEDSHADISRLESEIPSVAVWSEPRSDTTVIWLPDQP